MDRVVINMQHNKLQIVRKCVFFIFTNFYRIKCFFEVPLIVLIHGAGVLSWFQGITKPEIIKIIKKFRSKSCINNTQGLEHGF